MMGTEGNFFGNLSLQIAAKCIYAALTAEALLVRYVVDKHDFFP